MTRRRWLSVGCVLVAGAFGYGAGAAPPALVRALGEAEVDWSAGVISARGGAAADLRMPSADVARPGAVRRARAAAAARLRAALVDLPLGAGRRLSAAGAEAAVAKAEVLETELQSNGGAIVRLGVSFGRLVGQDGPDAAVAEDPAATWILSLPSAPLEIVPRLVVEGQEQALTHAVFRLGPAPAGALEARRDRTGRLVVAKGATGSQGAVRAVIYVDRIAPGPK